MLLGMLTPLTLLAVLAAAQFTPKQLEAARKDPGAFTIDESTVKIEVLGPAVSPAQVVPPMKDDDGLLILDKIINIGQKVWTIIEKNKPVVDVSNTYATALPEGSRGWSRLEGWSAPRGVVYGMTAKNAYGQTVLNVRWQVVRTFGGRLDGKGRYLTAVTVEPLLVEVLWGYHFSLSAEVPDTSIVNAGTKDDPVAAMTPTLKWQVKTAIKDSQGKAVYYIRGDGAFQEIGGPFARGFENAASKANAMIAF